MRAVALPVVGVNRTVRVGGARGGVVACDPLLVAVTGGVAVGVIIHIVKVVERPVFVVNTGIEHRNHDAFAVVASSISARRIHLRWHRSGSL